MPSVDSTYSRIVGNRGHWGFIPQRNADILTVRADQAPRPMQVEPHREPTPEQRLVQAILEDAVDVLRGKKAHLHNRGSKNRDDRWRAKSKQQDHDQALDWFASDEVRYGSFLFCCQHLSLEPGRIRKWVAQVDEQQSTFCHLTEPIKKPRTFGAQC